MCKLAQRPKSNPKETTMLSNIQKNTKSVLPSTATFDVSLIIGGYAECSATSAEDYSVVSTCPVEAMGVNKKVIFDDKTSGGDLLILTFELPIEGTIKQMQRNIISRFHEEEIHVVNERFDQFKPIRFDGFLEDEELDE